ncbi:MAG: hypothetical protein LUD72_04915, partial [Bacteroidales bacterium]|nr:hypothetical protein [Bacteroidales bacterium]
MNMTQEIPILHQNLLPQNHEAGVGTTINDDTLNTILNCVEKETVDSIAQPHLIVGASGSGKTHLLRRIESRIQKDDGQRFHPLFIEGRTLFSTDDLWDCTAELLQINGSSSPYADITEWQKA